jgi:type IV pilus assembly protein PilB
MEKTQKKIRGEVEISPILLTETKNTVKNISQFKKKIEEFLTKNTTDLVGVILAGAIGLNASDIHIEPEEERVKMRIRIDGILQDVIILELKIYQSLLSRIKLLSKLKLNIANRPQDGRFTILMPIKEKEIIIEIRTSTLPAEWGETIVMRTLNPENLIEIEALGLRKDLVEILNKEIKKPNGMILVTGPTGSGKTTTLYAILKKINNPEIKIITIEDPVEYHLEGLSQTQVDPSRGYNFANGLRAIMRQDPDIILVGEMRDLETAEIACQSALTGHLVFSTLHTNNAAGAIARLIDLGVKTATIAPTLNMVIAQRLPRKVCKKCVKFIDPPKEELTKIKNGLIKIKKEVLPPIFFNSKLKIPKPIGCEDCNFIGYRGRIGIYEFFLVNDEMEKFILTNPSIVMIKELAIKEGMILMYQDGLIKVLEGITTIEEVERVAGDI